VVVEVGAYLRRTGGAGAGAQVHQVDQGQADRAVSGAGLDESGEAGQELAASTAPVIVDGQAYDAGADVGQDDAAGTGLADPGGRDPVGGAGGDHTVERRSVRHAEGAVARCQAGVVAQGVQRAAGPVTSSEFTSMLVTLASPSR